MTFIYNEYFLLFLLFPKPPVALETYETLNPVVHSGDITGAYHD